MLKPALLDAYCTHYDHSNPLVDHPTRRVLRYAIMEEEDALAWGKAAIDAVVVTDDRARADGAEHRARISTRRAGL